MYDVALPYPPAVGLANGLEIRYIHLQKQKRTLINKRIHAPIADIPKA